LDDCKEGLQALHSSDDDGDDGGQERLKDAHMSNHVSIRGVDCGRASSDPNSNPLECFEHGSKDSQIDTEGNMNVDLVDYKVNPYKEALQMCDLPDGGGKTFFHLERHNCSPNIPYDEVCILFTCLYNFKAFLFFYSIFLLFCLTISVVFFI
jgi:hypothetical protein